jgi:repressor LexA
MALTRRQRQVLDVIQSFIDEQGYSPSLEEIGRQLGLSSVATVHKHVSHLVGKGYVRRGWNQNRSIEPVRADVEGIIELPMMGTIAAGQPIEAIAEQETLRVPSELVHAPGRSFALRVSGNSMIEEHICDGDYVLIEERVTANDGETVVALVEESEVTLKRFYREGERVRLQPANRDMDPIYVPADRVSIQGVVTGVIRRY